MTLYYYDLGYTLIYLHMLYTDFLCTRLINRRNAYSLNFKRINIYSSFETSEDA